MNASPSCKWLNSRFAVSAGSVRLVLLGLCGAPTRERPEPEKPRELKMAVMSWDLSWDSHGIDGIVWEKYGDMMGFCGRQNPCFTGFFNELYGG